MTFVIIVCAAAALVLLISYICVRETFYVRSSGRDEPKVPHEKQYIEVSDKIMGFINGASAIGYEDVYTESHDGLRLHAKFYAGREGAPTHILIHGYRSSALLDMGGALIDAVERGDNALLIDQRAHAGSQGKYLTFGYNESRDVLRWINYINERLGRDNPIVLQGLSMGGATVLLTTALELPENVKGVICDSAYTRNDDIIKFVMRRDHFPVWLLFPFLRLGGKLFVGYDICDCNPIEAAKKCKLPIYFIHGEEDLFVPFEMGMENHKSCPAKKWLFTLPDAGHGLCYLKDEAGYKKVFKEFIEYVL